MVVKTNRKNFIDFCCCFSTFLGAGTKIEVGLANNAKDWF